MLFRSKLKAEIVALKSENQALRARIHELHTSRLNEAETAQRLRRVVARMQKEVEIERGKRLRDDA